MAGMINPVITARQRCCHRSEYKGDDEVFLFHDCIFILERNGEAGFSVSGLINC